MASQNSSITAVHFSLIFFVMLSIILGVVSYMKIEEASRLQADMKKKDQEAATVKQDRDNNADTLTAFQKEAGYPGKADLKNPEKDVALAAIKADIAKLGDNTSNLRLAVFQRSIELQRLNTELNQEKKNYAQEKQSLLQQKNAAETQAKSDRAKLNAESARVAGIEKAKEEAIAAKQKELDDLNVTVRQLEKKNQDLVIAHEETVKKFEEKVRILQTVVAQKQKQIDELQSVSFERADGNVRWVDNSTKLVWINLGSADRLPERMSFSVYSQTHHGIARGREGIKGKIEITRIRGPHLAEARILENDPYDPIRAGDPIYTPLWRAGATESFAFVGILDLDGDGSDDRDVLHRIVKSAGATISNDIDANGVRHGNGLSSNDKFLVQGTIPDPQKTADPKERARRNAIAKAAGVILEEAKNRGVRIIKLSDFLAYIGYKANRRLWRPGDLGKRNLKAGSHSTTIDEVVGRRESSGQTSGLFSKRKTYGKRQSSGQTSKIFGR